jgi:urease accessory protein
MHLILDDNGNPVPHHDHYHPLEPGDRAVRIGIGGPVGSGKTALVAALCRELGSELKIGVVTNDIYTTEDADFLRREGVLDEDRIVAVETGCCPHTAIRDDISMNLDAVERLEESLGDDVDLMLIESGGDNLTAVFSQGLIDKQIFVLDTAGGDDVPRKGGPGVANADLLVVNKTDLAPLVGANLELMKSDAEARREGKPTIFASHAGGSSDADVVAWVRGQVTVPVA